MRQVLMFASVTVVIAPLAWAGPIETPTPLPPVYSPPPVIVVMPAQQLQPVTTVPSAPPLTPTVAPVAAPMAAPVAAMAAPPPRACEPTSPSECAAEATTCIAKKWVSRDHEYSQAPVFFVTNDEYGVPRIVRHASDVANDDDNAEAAECGGDLNSCLALPCGN